VRQGLINRDSAIGVEGEHFLDKVDGLLICASEQFVEVLPTVVRQLSHERTIVRILYLIDKCVLRLTNQVCDHHHLFLLGLGGKQRLAPNQLGEDATNRPNVDSGRVLPP